MTTKTTLAALAAFFAAFAAVGETTLVSTGESAPFAVDSRPAPRIAAARETLTYSTAWETDARGAVATICVDGVAVTNATEEGVFEWMPTRNGTYTFTHTVTTNGVAVAEPLTATFVVEGLSPKKPVFYYASGTIISGDSLSVSIS